LLPNGPTTKAQHAFGTRLGKGASAVIAGKIAFARIM
jgi:hypothetical protein